MTRSPRTAQKQKSIWCDISENVFRTHMIMLSKVSKEVPAWPSNNLPPVNIRSSPVFNLERMIAQDFAFLTAVYEGVESVSAACVINLGLDKAGKIVIRIASNQGVLPIVRSFLAEIIHLLQQCSRHELRRRHCQQDIHRKIIEVHQARLHGRLRSSKWIMPLHMRHQRETLIPLWTALQRLCQATSIIPLAQIDREFKQALSEMIVLMKKYDNIHDPEDEFKSLQIISEHCFRICTSNGVGTLQKTLQRIGLGTAAQESTWRQVEKIGNYYRIARDMVLASRKYPQIFCNIPCQYVEPFHPVSSSVSFSGRQVSCHVHAEIQLIVFNDLHPSEDLTTPTRPHNIGTSKAACFLCALFIRKHTQYYFSQEHAKLYDQWTIPDLQEYPDAIVSAYRNIIKSMNTDFLRLSRVKHPSRPFPLTSWQNFQRLPFTPEISSHSVSAATNEGLPQDDESAGFAVNVSFHSQSSEPVAPTMITAPDEKLSETSAEQDPGHQAEDSTSTVSDKPLPLILPPRAPLNRNLADKSVNPISSRYFHARSECIECFVEADNNTKVDLKRLRDNALVLDKQVWNVGLNDLEIGKDMIWTSTHPSTELHIVIQDDRSGSGRDTDRSLWLLTLRRNCLKMGTDSYLQESENGTCSSCSKIGT